MNEFLTWDEYLRLEQEIYEGQMARKKAAREAEKEYWRKASATTLADYAAAEKDNQISALKAGLNSLQAENRALQDRVTELRVSADEADARARKAQADAAAMREPLEYFTSDETSFAWNKDHYTCLRCVGKGRTPEDVDHTPGCEVGNGRKALETNAGADLLARLEKAEAERDAAKTAVERAVKEALDKFEYDQERLTVAKSEMDKVDAIALDRLHTIRKLNRIIEQIVEIAEEEQGDWVSVTETYAPWSMQGYKKIIEAAADARKAEDASD